MKRAKPHVSHRVFPLQLTKDKLAICVHDHLAWRKPASTLAPQQDSVVLCHIVRAVASNVDVPAVQDVLRRKIANDVTSGHTFPVAATTVYCHLDIHHTSYSFPGRITLRFIRLG